MNKPQRTLASTASLAGVGLFSGAPVRIAIHPAAVDTGILFLRSDIPSAPPLAANPSSIVARSRRSALASDGVVVEMVEHALSALMGLGIDNATIELDAQELPIFDGSATPYVEAVLEAGTVEQDQLRNPIVIASPITVTEGDASVTAIPGDADALEIVYLLDYGPDSPITAQSHSFTLRPGDPAGTYQRDIAPARTFSTLAEAKAARAAGMFKHLDPSDMLVIGEQGPVDNEYRFTDEPARHKLLDLIGDLALAGRPIRGRVIAHRSGHALNQQLAAALASSATTEAP